MAAFMKPFESQTYAALRIMAGAMFLFHGTQKLFDFPKEFAMDLNPMMIVAGVLELVGGALIAVGFMTRWAAFVCSGLMAAAYWIAHGTKDFFPINNGGEPAALYCFLFLFIAAKGSGIWSVDGGK